MINTPGSTRTWRGRYRTLEGEWRWIEAVNTNRLDDPDNPGVFTLMQPARADAVSVQEELRAREELLARLSDALPVGIFQVDAERRVLSTNGRLHQILCAPPSGDLASQFEVVVYDDWVRLQAAIDAVLSGEDVDNLELRFHVAVPHPEFAATRVCQVSLRPLTDGAGAVTGAVGTLSDATDSVELRRELELARPLIHSRGASTAAPPSSSSTALWAQPPAARPESPRSTWTSMGSRTSTTATAT